MLGSIAPAVIYGENRDRCGVQTPVNQPSTMHQPVQCKFDVTAGDGISNVSSSPVQRRRQFYCGRASPEHASEHGIHFIMCCYMLSVGITLFLCIRCFLLPGKQRLY